MLSALLVNMKCSCVTKKDPNVKFKAVVIDTPLDLEI